MTENIEFDFDNIPLDHLGFDSQDLKKERENQYMQDIADLIQSTCDSAPEIKEFKSLMNNFFIGEVELTDRGIYIPQALNLTEENADEIYEIIQNHIEYPDDENLKARIFTQAINKEIIDNFAKYGIVIDNKYKVANNGVSFNVTPQFHISDPYLFIEFLQKIKICDEDTILGIDTILGSHEFWLDEFFLSGKDISNSDEVSDFMVKSFELYEELERLEIEERLMNLQVRDLALVTSNGILQEYLKFKKLGFFGQLYPDNFDISFKIPRFIYEALDICSQYQDEEDLDDCISSIKESINKSLILLSNIRNQNILFQPLKEELQYGIRQLIEYVDENPYIEIQEKSKIISPITYQAQELTIL
ncbi:MAG: hypothetical protein WAZ12_04855 [Candidatus Absconditicoccaceae bacterium]